MEEMEVAIMPNNLYPEISKEMKIAEAGIIVFQFHLERMITNENGTVLGEDIEALHDMRVASRRLRVAIDQFRHCYEKRSVKKISKGLRRIGKNLGDVRDLDVIIERLTDTMNHPPQQYGHDLQLLFDYLEKKRKLKRENLTIFLGCEVYKSSTKFFQEFVKSPKQLARANNRMDQVGDFSKNIIEQQKAEIDKFDSKLINPTIRQLHKLRIAFKRFRYIVEFFINSLGDEAPHKIEFLKSIQDHLGEINDISMMIREIEDMKRNSGESEIEFLTNHKGIIRFLSDRHNELTTMVNDFPVLWRQYQDFSFDI